MRQRSSPSAGPRYSQGTLNGSRYALCTMCIGVGQGLAVVLERV